MNQHSVQPVETQRKVTPFDLESFRTRLVVMFRTYRAKHYPNLRDKEVSVRRGRRYSRIFHGTSCYCFVEMATGDILKPATLKQPAKHARGNVHNADPLGCCGPHGVAYMK